MSDWADAKARELYGYVVSRVTIAAALREARRAALEEAVTKVSLHMDRVHPEVAFLMIGLRDAIRALMEKPNADG